MEEINAYVDESGDANFTKGATEKLVFSAILVKRSSVPEIEERLNQIKEELNLPEYKSSRIKEKRRITILERVCKLDFKVVYLVINKNLINAHWRKYTGNFYKFTQKLLNSLLYENYKNVSVRVDKYGTPNYQKSLQAYIKKEIEQTELFGNDFSVGSAKSDVFIQLADFLGGTKRKLIDGTINNKPAVENYLSRVSLITKTFPVGYPHYTIDNELSLISDEIGRHSLEAVKEFIRSSKKNSQFEIEYKIADYLFSQIRYNDKTKYTYGAELLDWLQQFDKSIQDDDMKKAISRLRDNGVVICGTSKGYKIPLNRSEFIDYFISTSKKYVPMMQRIKRATDILKTRSMGTIDILEEQEFQFYKTILDPIEI